MLSPSPLSLFCAILLCLPLVIIFTFTTPNSTTTRTIQQNTLNPKPNKITATIIKDNDLQLFQLASRVNTNPTKSKKIAFMFLTTTPLHFSPLWELFFNQTTNNFYNIYIHADPTFNYTPPFSGVFSSKLILSKPTRRFSPTLISAARRLLSHALLHDRANYMFTLLSSSCIPLHSFNFTYETLTSSNKSFVEILNNEVGAYDRWVARGPDAMLPQVTLESFRIGSQFWAMTRKHARIVVSDRHIWSKFKLHCVRVDTCYPEENYFPTLLHMLDPQGCVPATLTHVDWRGRFDGHPRMYNADEVGPGLITRLRVSKPRYGDFGINCSGVSVPERSDPFLFARKFSPDSVGPLMSIARDVILED